MDFDLCFENPFEGKMRGDIEGQILCRSWT